MRKNHHFPLLWHYIWWNLTTELVCLLKSVLTVIQDYYKGTKRSETLKVFFTTLKRRLTSNLSNCGGRCFWYQLDHDIGFQTSSWLMMICFSCWTIKNYLSNILQCRINPRHNKKPTVRWFFPWQYFLIFAAETLLASVKTRVILYFYEKLVG